jgi:hypothetical protein
MMKLPLPISVADSGGVPARNGEVLADLVAVADAQVAARAVEILVERIGAEHGAGGDFVVGCRGWSSA